MELNNGSFLRRLVEKLADKVGARRSAGFPWSKGIPDRNFPKPMTGGSGCVAPVVLICVIAAAALILLISR
jgi:hypothetical protein